MIASTFIKRPVTAIVISIVLTIAGLICMYNLPLDQFPKITPPGVSVSATYTGADAQTVEQTVTIPIEEQINGVPGMMYLQSTNTQTGSAGISVTFNVGTDINIATLNVQNRVGLATPVLPSAVTQLGVTVRARNPDQLMNLAIYSPRGTHDISFLDNYTNTFIVDALLRVPGVGDVQSRGNPFSMRIWMDPSKMASFGLMPSDVITALQSQNIYIAAGAVGTPPQPLTQTNEYTIVVNSMLSKPKEYENVIVKTIPSTGELVYLKDIAKVGLGQFSYGNKGFADGKLATTVLIYQSPTSNALQTAVNIYAELEELKKSFPPDVDYSIPFENVTIIRVSISEVVKTLFEALGLVVIVVFLFLQNWRSAIIPIVAIPVSIISTFIIFIPLGFTINTLTLFGLVLAIGIVVDDAIIVVEAVQHFIDREQLSAKEATYRAMKEISAPVVAIALILASVFVPVGFIPGITGKLYQQFAITIAISVVFSAFIALSLTPALCSLLLKPTKITKESKGLNKMFFRFNNWFEKVTVKYSEGVKRCIKYSALVVLTLVIICFGALFLFKKKPTGFIPSEDGGRVLIGIQLPEGTATTQTEELLQKAMKIVGETPGVLHYNAISGLNVLSGGAVSNAASIFCMLKPWSERNTPETQIPGIMDVIKKRIAAAGIKNANITINASPAIRGLGTASGFSIQIEQGNTNDDIHAFETVMNNFVAELKKHPATATAYCNYSAHTPAFDLLLDRVKCQKLGVNVADVFSTIQAFMGSSVVGNFTLYNRTYRAIVQSDTAMRALINNLEKYYVRNSAGEMLPLSTIVSYKPISTAPLITHFNIFRSAEVDGSTPLGYSTGQGIETLKEVAAKVLPRGYTYEFSGLSYQEIQAGSITIYIFLFSIIFVFLFLAALYESWSVPLSVMLAVPISAFGAIFALTTVPSLSNNVYAQIGLITLIGLSAKNAILIVEFAKVRVDRGEDLIKSTIEAVRLRLRPIIMTSMAFILGVTPMVLASGAGAQSRKTIGVTVQGGMVASSCIAIFIVPVLFVLFTRLSYGKKKLAWLAANHDLLMEKERKVEAQSIDPELEYDIAQARDEKEQK
ncbi:hydrophobe/amphiphile efflux-1 family RND transporter [Chitinophaga silvatica]|uniref:Hydrophobe/amphiphile efflux-1 family RND transporter n=1 Tax=Chitinophaga silvatica TaxID=2282649 RepID=A0A3E1Y606_9BACT|nr:efflux RND transporter permease subunit [Chitinophaga silvatica]RFS20155.1 hydrophobe/amphiphile efflux-1 family RND transporter [Chitinophaga silvatica]